MRSASVEREELFGNRTEASSECERNVVRPRRGGRGKRGDVGLRQMPENARICPVSAERHGLAPVSTAPETFPRISQTFPLRPSVSTAPGRKRGVGQCFGRGGLNTVAAGGNRTARGISVVGGAGLNQNERRWIPCSNHGCSNRSQARGRGRGSGSETCGGSFDS